LQAGDRRKALDIFGLVFIQFYGQAEATGTISCLPKAEHLIDTEQHLRRMPLPAAKPVRVLDSAGNELPPGEVGEMCVRGDLVVRGYLEPGTPATSNLTVACSSLTVSRT
jgi:acyl-CoA synthetase (AMP-forming)/AMP-acid ligase II